MVKGMAKERRAEKKSVAWQTLETVFIFAFFECVGLFCFCFFLCGAPIIMCNLQSAKIKKIKKIQGCGEVK
jgi:hypothetical protein